LFGRRRRTTTRKKKKTRWAPSHTAKKRRADGHLLAVANKQTS
jgi:hypothetical protein